MPKCNSFTSLKIRRCEITIINKHQNKLEGGRDIWLRYLSCVLVVTYESCYIFGFCYPEFLYTCIINIHRQNRPRDENLRRLVVVFRKYGSRGDRNPICIFFDRSQTWASVLNTMVRSGTVRYFNIPVYTGMYFKLTSSTCQYFQ